MPKPYNPSHWSAHARDWPHVCRGERKTVGTSKGAAKLCSCEVGETHTGAQAVWMALSAYADGGSLGRCYPSVALLQHSTGLSYQGVYTALLLLEADGFIRRRKRVGKISNVFRLIRQADSPPDRRSTLLTVSTVDGQQGGQDLSAGLTGGSAGLILPVSGADTKYQEGPNEGPSEESPRAREETLSLPIDELQPQQPLQERLESVRAEFGLPDTPFVRKRVREHVRLEAEKRKAAR